MKQIGTLKAYQIWRETEIENFNIVPTYMADKIKKHFHCPTIHFSGNLVTVFLLKLCVLFFRERQPGDIKTAAACRVFIRWQCLLRDRGGELRATQLPVVQGRGEALRYHIYLFLTWSTGFESVRQPLNLGFWRPQFSESVEWFIEEQAFSPRMIWLLPPPSHFPPSSPVRVSLSQSSCVSRRSSLLTGERGGGWGGWAKLYDGEKTWSFINH